MVTVDGSLDNAKYITFLQDRVIPNLDRMQHEIFWINVILESCGSSVTEMASQIREYGKDVYAPFPKRIETLIEAEGNHRKY